MRTFFISGKKTTQTIYRIAFIVSLPAVDRCNERLSRPRSTAGELLSIYSLYGI